MSKREVGRKEFITNFVTVLAASEGPMTTGEILKSARSSLSESTKKTYSWIIKNFLRQNKYISEDRFKFAFTQRDLWGAPALTELVENIDTFVREGKESYRKSPTGTGPRRPRVTNEDSYGIAFEHTNGVLDITVSGDAIRSIKIDSDGDVTLSLVSGKSAVFPTK